MKLVRAILASLLLAPTLAICAPIFSNVATLSGGTLIDFEGQANGANANNLYSGLGVTFSTAISNARIWNPALVGNQLASSGSGVLGPSGPGTDPLDITFASAQSFAEFFFADPNVFPGTTYAITAYGAGDVMLETLAIPAGSLPGSYFVGFARGTADIFRIAVDPSNGGENFSIDDLRFETAAAVPEPSSVALLGLALAGLAALRRRNQA